MKFLKNLFKKKEKPQKKEVDIKPFIAEFVESGMLEAIKSKKVASNAEFILNTLSESNINPNSMSQVEAMGLLFKIGRRVGISKKALNDVLKLFKLFFKFMDEKGVITEEMKREMPDMGIINPPQTFRRETPKIGRNQPCFCGSGKKYKICCGR